MGGVTALGDNWASIRRCLQEGTTGVRRMSAWDRYHGINTRLAAPVTGFDVEGRYDRKKLRTMGAVARMAVYATERALTHAGLLDDHCIRNGRAGIAYGSSFGSPKPVLGFAELMMQGASSKLTGTSYVQMMSYTAAVNIGLNGSP